MLALVGGRELEVVLAVTLVDDLGGDGAAVGVLDVGNKVGGLHVDGLNGDGAELGGRGRGEGLVEAGPGSGVDVDLEGAAVNRLAVEGDLDGLGTLIGGGEGKNEDARGSLLGAPEGTSVAGLKESEQREGERREYGQHP